MLLVTGGTGYLGAALLVSGRAAGGTALVDPYLTYPRLGSISVQFWLEPMFGLKNESLECW
jgi:hypothetical protein